MPADSPVLFSASESFDAAFNALVFRPQRPDREIERRVRTIIERVEKEGDAALLALTRELDDFDASRIEDIRVAPDEITRAVDQTPGEIVAALRFAAGRIAAHHERQKPDDEHYRDAAGVELGAKHIALDAVGVYVPGGRACYPSSVLMNVIPAQIAGVARIVMTVPAPGGKLAPMILAAAQIAGVSEIYRVGGAQAVAAMALGTQSVDAVDKIVGPGNAYVAEAKRQLFGRVGIDMIAGPSEIAIIADADNDPAWIAADLLAQAEHDPLSRAILMTDSAAFAQAVGAAIAVQLKSLERREIASRSWQANGALIVTPDLEEASRLVNLIAPEHLELAVADPEALLAHIRHAGTVFLGRHTPEAIGDYVAGSNHVLPTGRSARFASGLSVRDFIKTTNLVRCDAAALAGIGPMAVVLADAESLGGHAASVQQRLNCIGDS